MPAFRPSSAFLAWFLIGLLLVHGWALITSAYFYIWWLDLLLHLAGGFWVGSVGICLFRKTPFSKFLFFLAVVSFAALIGVLWELFEFITYQLWGTLGYRIFFQLGLEDTLGDLLSDLVGGALAAILFRREEKKL